MNLYKVTFGLKNNGVYPKPFVKYIVAEDFEHVGSLAKADLDYRCWTSYEVKTVDFIESDIIVQGVK